VEADDGATRIVAARWPKLMVKAGLPQLLP